MKLKRRGSRESASGIWQRLKARFSARRPVLAQASGNEGKRVFVLVKTSKLSKTFEITEGGAADIGENPLPASGAVVIVFESAESKREIPDHRIQMPKALKGRALRDQINEVVGERARIIRSPQSNRLVYAREVSSLEQFGTNQVIPGALVVDHFAKSEENQPQVVAFVLRGLAGDIAAVIAYTVVPDEEAGIASVQRMTFSNQPQDTVDSIVGEYCAKAASATKRNDFKMIEPIGPTDGELWRLAGSLPSYPVENDIGGVPMSKLYRVTCIGSAALACMSIAGNAALGLEAEFRRQSANDAVAARDALQKKIVGEFTEQIRHYAKSGSVDHTSVIQAAKDVWQPNSLASIECTAMSCSIEVAVAANRRESALAGDSGQSLMSQAVDESVIRAVIKQQAPAGFTKKDIAITGDGNVVTVTFEQQKPNTPVQRMLPH